MNKDAEGQAVAFVGRVPLLVKGAITKGERVYANCGGFGTTDANGEQIGFALESNSEESTKLVEVVLDSFLRLAKSILDTLPEQEYMIYGFRGYGLSFSEPVS